MPNLAKIKTFDGLMTETQYINPAAAQSTANSIVPGVRNVRLLANVNDANDFTVLPPLASVPDGFSLTIVAGTAANSELRTPASSNEKINGQDGDGTKEALLTATSVYTLTKVDNTAGWVMVGHTALGAFEAAVVPD